MKLLVTGGAGYIGSVVSRQLLRAGHEVVVLDNLERGHRAAVAPEARFVHADLRDAHAVSEALAYGFDGVLHFAALALVGESVKHPGLYYRTNVEGTMNLLDAIRASEVPRLVFSSTCAVYGEPNEVPNPENAPPPPRGSHGPPKGGPAPPLAPAPPGHRLRGIQVGRRHDDLRLLPCARHRRGEPALLQCGRGQRRRGRGSLSRDAPHPQHPAHRPGTQLSR